MDYMLVSLAATIVFAAVSIPLHELGHLFFGRLTGYRLVMFRFFVWVIYRDEGRWTIRTCRTGMPLTAQCQMIPDVSEDRFRFGWYNAGGVIVNVILAMICFTVWAVVDITSLWAIVWFVGLVINTALVIVNGVPISKELMTDGWNMKEAMRSDVSRGDLYRVFRITGAQADGVTSAEMPAEWFDAPGGKPPDSTFGWVRVMMSADRLAAIGDREEAVATYASIDVSRLPRFYAGNVLAELWYAQLVYGLGPQIDPNRMPKPLKAFMKMTIPTAFRLKAAIAAFVHHDPLEAHAMLDRARAALPGAGSEGLIVMERAEIDELMTRIQ